MKKSFKGTLNDFCEHYLDIFEQEDEKAKEDNALSTKIGVPVKVTDAEIILPKTIHIVIDDISEEACRKIASAVNRYIKNY
jgi:hypothetical protein